MCIVFLVIVGGGLDDIHFAFREMEEVVGAIIFSILYLLDVRSGLLSVLLAASFSASIDRASFLDLTPVCMFILIPRGKGNFKENS